MKVFIVFLIFLSTYTHVSASNYMCSDPAGGCDGEDLNLLHNGASVSYFTQQTQLNFLTPGDEKNLSHFRLLSKEAQELRVEMKSRNIEEGASNFVFLGTILDFLDINLNGRHGEDGVNASSFCAQNYLSGDYGEEFKDNFITRHSEEDPVCDDIDARYIEESFSCPEGYEDKTESGGIQRVSRLEKERLCSTTLKQRYCVKRTLDISCKIDIAGPNCGCSPAQIVDHTDLLISQANQMGDDLSWSNTPPTWTCDPYACTEAFKTNPESPVEKPLRNIGSSATQTFRVDEQLVADFGQEYACLEKFNEGQVSFNMEWGENEQSFVQLLTDPNDQNSKDSINGMNFLLKHPAIIPDLGDGPREIRINIDSTVGMTGGVRISGCLGMNDSDGPDDLSCILTAKTESFVLVLTAFDKNGAESSPFNLVVQGHDASYLRSFSKMLTNSTDIILPDYIEQGGVASCDEDQLPNEVLSIVNQSNFILTEGATRVREMSGQKYIDFKYKRENNDTEYRVHYIYNNCNIEGFL